MTACCSASRSCPSRRRPVVRSASLFVSSRALGSYGLDVANPFCPLMAMARHQRFGRFRLRLHCARLPRLRAAASAVGVSGLPPASAFGAWSSPSTACWAPAPPPATSAGRSSFRGRSATSSRCLRSSPSALSAWGASPAADWAVSGPRRLASTTTSPRPSATRSSSWRTSRLRPLPGPAGGQQVRLLARVLRLRFPRPLPGRSRGGAPRHRLRLRRLALFLLLFLSPLLLLRLRALFILFYLMDASWTPSRLYPMELDCTVRAICAVFFYLRLPTGLFMETVLMHAISRAFGGTALPGFSPPLVLAWGRGCPTTGTPRCATAFP